MNKLKEKLLKGVPRIKIGYVYPIDPEDPNQEPKEELSLSKPIFDQGPFNFIELIATKKVKVGFGVSKELKKKVSGGVYLLIDPRDNFKKYVGIGLHWKIGR